MEQRRPEQHKAPPPEKTPTPNFSKPVWHDQQMSCEQCRYNGQDIDTFPCAKCHTRN